MICNAYKSVDYDYEVFWMFLVQVSGIRYFCAKDKPAFFFFFDQVGSNNCTPESELAYKFIFFFFFYRNEFGCKNFRLVIKQIQN